VTPFHFEHDFQAESVAAVFAAYFDDELNVEHDRQSGILRRELLETADGPDRLETLARIFPERQLPVFVRPFVSGPLHYVERLVWDKAADRIESDIRPSLLARRARIHLVYAARQTAPGVVRRIYEGDVSVEIALIGHRIEKMIVDDIARTLVDVEACTQEWLDAHIGRV
jgi:Protein of unknown function (DUF2505)